MTSFLHKVQKEFGLANGNLRLCKDRQGSGQLNTSKRSTLASQSLKHGDMVYLIDDVDSTPAGTSNDDVPDSTVSTEPLISKDSDNGLSSQTSYEIDEVDCLLEKQSGLIHRKRNELLCHHGPSGKCLHCVPLEPYDESYLRSCEPPIKFLSFHSYLRKLTGGVDRGKFASLENLRCKIKSGCKEHPPWPGGICTKCQPNAVTLNRQVYRHIDHIVIENPTIADQFLNYWRHSGNQRLGYLYGRYDAYPNVPLGIRATVVAIYEPPQVSEKSSIQLLPDPNESVVNGIAAKLGIGPLGWIFTDLLAENLSKGTVKHFRGNMDSHFLSAEECIMAATLQNKYPNHCRLSSDGHFGSKFVTIVVTGDSSNQIHFDGYQVSNQCMALVRDNCFIPTKDAPQLGYIKESSNVQYVPDVFYKEKDEYGNEVTQLARPLPVEYLLVDMPVTFPVEPQYSFNKTSYKTFPIENRSSLGELQEFNDLMTYLEQFPRDKFLEAMSDFHLLIFLATFDMLPLKGHMDMILEAVKTGNAQLVNQFRETDEWATVEQMFAAHDSPPTSSRQTSMSGSTHRVTVTWTCAHCTFINQEQSPNCEMCSLPKQ